MVNGSTVETSPADAAFSSRGLFPAGVVAFSRKAVSSDIIIGTPDSARLLLEAWAIYKNCACGMCGIAPGNSHFVLLWGLICAGKAIDACRLPIQAFVQGLGWQK
jgi:hypothetical protein